MIVRNDNNLSQPIGILAEFTSAAELVRAAETLSDRGYRKLDAFSPYPIHELSAALKLRPSPLGWCVLAAGVFTDHFGGGLVCLRRGDDYPYRISGKPMFSLPANIPITFEVVILCAAFTAFFGVLLFTGLPRLSNPLHRCERFLRGTNDRFFLFVKSEDTLFSEHQTLALLRSIDASYIETVQATVESRRVPRAFWNAMAIVAVLAVIPPLLIARARATRSDSPPLAWFPDMDYQPKFKAQTKSSLFSDGRAMRPPLAGTVARGELRADDAYFRGQSGRDESRLVDTVQAARNDFGADFPKSKAWVQQIPVPITAELMRRGRQRFNIFCANCHGRAGDGNGPVTVRALALEQGTWVPPTSIHAEHVRAQPVGKLFNAITNGVRKMPGYASQIEPEDRWAIVLYLRAMQRTRDATVDDLTPDEVMKLRDLK